MIRTSLSLATLATLAAVLVACSDSPTEPPTLSATPSVASHRAFHGGAQPRDGQAALVRCERHPTYVGSAEIGPRGGVLRVGSSRVIVPPGALNRKVFITATMPEGEFITIRFEFQPHGLVFRKPAGLILNAAGCNLEDWAAPDIVYLSDDGEILERLDSYYSPFWHTVAAPIWHFSGYAIAW